MPMKHQESFCCVLTQNQIAYLALAASGFFKSRTCPLADCHTIRTLRRRQMVDDNYDPTEIGRAVMVLLKHADAIPNELL